MELTRRTPGVDIKPTLGTRAVGALVYSFNAGCNPTGPLGALPVRLGDDLVRYTNGHRCSSAGYPRAGHTTTESRERS
jgi:hypothetical protein